MVVDVREPGEWQHGHIDGSVPAPRGLLEFFADPTSPRHKEAIDPAKRTIVVCASGARAIAGGAHAEDHGLRGRRRDGGRPQGLGRPGTAYYRARGSGHLVRTSGDRDDDPGRQ